MVIFEVPAAVAYIAVLGKLKVCAPRSSSRAGEETHHHNNFFSHHPCAHHSRRRRIRAAL